MALPLPGLTPADTRYALEIKFLDCWSRFATRCLKLRGTAPKSGRKRARTTAQVKLPGEDLRDEERVVGEDGFATYPFSDTEEEVAAMDPKQGALYAEIKKLMSGDHASDDQWELVLNESELITDCFKVAVEKLLPGHSCDFELHLKEAANGDGDVDEDAGAKRQIAYMTYQAIVEAGGGAGSHRGGVNAPFGHKLTPCPALSDSERARVDAAFALLVERLGLEAVGEPGLKLVTCADLG